jgi:hypothetical protein
MQSFPAILYLCNSGIHDAIVSVYGLLEVVLLRYTVYRGRLARRR